ncbi:MAG: 4-(cytidine 5'-diphospho)-2-C-methyl-D-erythritol kinase [Rhodospirillaceae bacterium]|nr:4-(cytidine 5'-diphospho)-2-C-methyl-D-erythritol kinase [Rhodospirillaceae bacterium]
MTGADARSVAIDAPAKVNLYLHITGRRGDGFHTLDSLIAFAAPFDRISVAEAPALSLDISGPFAPALHNASEPNLVETAARHLAALAEMAGIAPGAHITLDKQLPVAAGIGGGSSDAATALRALVALWGLTLDPAALAALALSLGADVPMCLYGRTCFAGGIGEIIDPAPTLPDCALLLVNPGVSLATPDVFRARQGNFSAPARFEQAARDGQDLAEILAARGNDLEAPATALAPVIGETLAALNALPGCRLARMSGSGATCFALFDDDAVAADGADSLRARHSGWWIVPSRFVQAN